MEELDMSRELVYLQIVAGDTYIMLNEIKWGGSEAIMAAVGQSITTVTPVAMARYVAAVANGGKVYDLRLIDSHYFAGWRSAQREHADSGIRNRRRRGSGISGGAAARHERRY